MFSSGCIQGGGESMNFHPYSEIFPLLEGAALEELAENIKANGLREDIWLYEGKILDGRNRFIACEKAGVRPVYRKYIGKDPLGLVVSLNVHRRHLTESQRAMAAARIATLQSGQRAAPIGAAGAVTQANAAENLNVGRRSVQRARKVIEDGSKALQQAVDKGQVSVAKAAAVVDLPKSEQLKAAIAKPEKPREPSESDLMPNPGPLTADEIAEMDEAAELASSELAAKIMESDDRLAAADAEVQRLARELAEMRRHRDYWLTQAGANAKFAKRLQSTINKKDGEIASLKRKLGLTCSPP